MKLTLVGHDDRYAVEQLQMSLFGTRQEGEATSSLHRGKQWISAVTVITVDGKTSRVVRRIKTAEESVRLRRQLLQQCYYQAALPFLPQPPAWGAISGVRPTKITTKLLLEGGTERAARKLLKQVYYVTEPRIDLAMDCSRSTVAAVNKLTDQHISLYIGIPFCPTRCTYCSFVSRSIGKRTELMEPYLQALYKELEHTGKLLANSGKQVQIGRAHV